MFFLKKTFKVRKWNIINSEKKSVKFVKAIKI